MIDGFDVNQSVIIWESSEPRSRETLYLEKNNTPLLAKHYSTWKHRLSHKEPDRVLADLLYYLRTEVFNLHFCHRDVIQNIVDGAGSELVSIELFVQQKAGICRHFAFAAYYFLEKMRLENILPIDSVEVVRKMLYINGFQGRHAWLSISMREANRSFHFDPFWGIVIDNSDPNAQEILRKVYGLL